MLELRTIDFFMAELKTNFSLEDNLRSSDMINKLNLKKVKINMKEEVQRKELQYLKKNIEMIFLKTIKTKISIVLGHNRN